MSRYGAVTFQCFTHEQIKDLNIKIKKNIFQKQDPSDASSYVSKIGKFFHVSCYSLMELIHPWLHQCQRVNREAFGYGIDWDFHLDILTYNVYGVEGEYGWHIDSGVKNSSVSDLKLTCMVNLSEKIYEGGEFYAINSNEKIKFTSGMGLVIPSFIAHKVTPITKGERIILVYGALGPTWR